MIKSDRRLSKIIFSRGYPICMVSYQEIRIDTGTLAVALGKDAGKTNRPGISAAKMWLVYQLVSRIIDFSGNISGKNSLRLCPAKKSRCIRTSLKINLILPNNPLRMNSQLNVPPLFLAPPICKFLSYRTSTFFHPPF